MVSPTKQAEGYFTSAQRILARTLPGSETNLALANRAQGLEHLATGVRATYMLLEEVQKELRQKSRGQ